MKKIGFIDYYLDEWHANTYPKMIMEQTNGEFQVCYCYGEVALEGRLSNEEWAKKYGMELLPTIEEVIEKSDYIIVLCPNNPEHHERLTDLVLKSGKRTYVDKTFAPTAAAAKRIYANAEAHNTPFFSTSALRYSEEIAKFDKDQIHAIYTRGAGTYAMYSIHQIEQIVILMGTSPKRVMFTGDETHPSMIIEFADGRRAHMHQGDGAAFETAVVDANNKYHAEAIKSDFFGKLMAEVIAFFKTGEVPVKKEETIAVAAIREAGFEAMEKPFTWVDVI